MEKRPEQHSSEKLRGGAEDVAFRNMDRLGTWDPRRPFVRRIAETHRVLVVVRSLERLKDMDTRLQIQADQLQQLQAQLDRLTQAPSSEESDEPG